MLQADLDLSGVQCGYVPDMPALPLAVAESIQPASVTTNSLTAARQAAAQTLHSIQEAKQFNTAFKPEAWSRPTIATRSITPAATNQSALQEQLVLTVTVCKPGKTAADEVMLEIQVLGSTTLSQLRDVITCPMSSLAASAAASAPSAYMHIEGKFYNDMRQASAIDYSKVLQEYCQQQQIKGPVQLLDKALSNSTVSTVSKAHAAGVGEGQVQSGADNTSALASLQAQGSSIRSMDDYCFRDLDVRVGNQPTYVYCHQGCCEHAMFVSDAWLMHGADEQNMVAYPRVVSHMTNKRGRRCGVCSQWGAEHVLVKHPDVPADPCVVCAPCLEMLTGSSDATGADGGQQHGGDFEVLLLTDKASVASPCVAAPS